VEAETGASLPDFSKDEFDAFLECGIFMRELGDASRVPLSGRAMVIERCWSARVVRAPHSWANALRQLAQEIGDRREVWTYCINPDRELRQEIEAAGFRLRNRVVQVRALHVAHWSRIASAF
jgi:hypothetical protein